MSQPPNIPASHDPSERARQFTTVSGHPIRRVYTPADLAGWDEARDLALPGEPPLTRGIHSTMYRGRLWSMRQFAGFGTAEDSNARYRYLLSAGTDGPVGGLRSAHADGLRLRSRDGAGRSRQMRRGRQLAGGHGSAVRPNSAGARHHLDDHQLAGGGRSGPCTWPWRKSRARTGRRFPARCRTTS